VFLLARHAHGEVVVVLALAHDFPPPGAVKYYLYTWRDDGTDQTTHDLLRWQVREKARRKADPSLVVLDIQSVHAAAGVPAESTGRDAAKMTGRRRGLAVDILRLVIAVVVVAASAHENAVGITLLDKVAAAADTAAVEKALVDQGFKNAVVAHGQQLGIEVEIVERAYGILTLHRRPGARLRAPGLHPRVAGVGLDNKQAPGR
jgi:hypothetical protein